MLNYKLVNSNLVSYKLVHVNNKLLSYKLASNKLVSNKFVNLLSHVSCFLVVRVEVGVIVIVVLDVASVVAQIKNLKHNNCTKLSTTRETNKIKIYTFLNSVSLTNICK